MTPKLTDTPQRLAALACLGSVLAVGGFFAVNKSHDSVPTLLVCALLTLVGAGLVYWAPYQLREGVLNQRWPAEQIAPLRRIVKHKAWTAMTFVLLAAMLFALLRGYTDHHHHGNYFWSVFLLLQMMTQLSGAFRVPYVRPGGTPPRIDWTQIPPLQSDHWGER